MEKERIKMGGVFNFVCYDNDGNVRWEDDAFNLVVNEGLDHNLDVLFAGETQITTWYIGLTDSTPTVAAADTLSSHSGWTEFDEYTGNRQEFVDVRSDRSVSNSASKASFPITTDGTVGGAFLCSVSTGTTGTLLSAAARTGGDRAVETGDTIEVTYTFSASGS